MHDVEIAALRSEIAGLRDALQADPKVVSAGVAIRLAVAAERARCAQICEEVEAQAWALWRTTADPIEQGRHIGAQHCADAIRAQPVTSPGGA